MLNKMLNTDQLNYVLSQKFPQMHCNTLQHNFTKSPTDGSSTETILITFTPIQEDEDELPSSNQVNQVLYNYFSLPCNLLHANHKLQRAETEWLNLFTEVNQKQDYMDENGNHCICTDTYRYITVVLTDLTIHITITNPAL